MARPGDLDGLGCADASATWVAGGAEPMVLGSTSGPGSQSVVRHAIICAAEELLGQLGIVGHETGGQVGLLLFEDLEHALFVLVRPFGDDLEGSEKLGGQKLELLGATEVLQRHEDGSGFEGTIDGWDRVVLQGLATEEDLRAIELHDGVDVLLDLIVAPGEDRAASQVRQVTLGRLRGHLVEEVGLSPVPVEEEDRLSGALLTRVVVRVVVALPGNVVNISLVLWYIRSDNFPVISAIFEADAALEHL